jgi:hypothetical protein
MSPRTDLSQTPPLHRTLAPQEIVSSERDTKLAHPPATIDYTAPEYADLIASSEIGEMQWPLIEAAAPE